MATRLRERATVQDWINLICGLLLIVSPWALGFSDDALAARTAWAGGVVIAVMAIAALVQFAEWEEWVALAAGVLVVIAPWTLGFAGIGYALWACVILGIVAALASMSEIWTAHRPPAPAR